MSRQSSSLKRCDGPKCQEMTTHRFCSSTCKTQYYYYRSHAKYRAKANELYATKKHNGNQIHDSRKLVIVEDPTDTAIPGYIFPLRLIKYDLNHNPDVWPAGTKFKTESDKAVIVRAQKLWYEDGGRELR